MISNRLLSIITNTIQKNSNNYSSNELFGLLSLILLIQIVDIFEEKSSSSIPEVSNSTPSNNIGNLASLGNLSGLLAQLQGNGDGKNLQQMLPMLIGALSNGGSNSGIDMGNISKLVQSISKNNQQDNSEISNHQIDTEQIESNKKETKKKAIQK